MRRSVLIVVATLAVVVVAVAAATGAIAAPWGDSVGSARFGRAPAASGWLAVRAQPGAVVPAHDWPDACGLLTETDIRAILPDATGLEATLVCADGALMFEVGGSTTTDFGDFRAYSFWRDTVLPEFALAVANRTGN